MTETTKGIVNNNTHEMRVLTYLHILAFTGISRQFHNMYVHKSLTSCTVRESIVQFVHSYTHIYIMITHA